MQLFDLVGNISIAGLSSVTNGLNSLTSHLNNIGSKFNQLGQNLTRVGGGLTQFGGMMTRNVTMPIIGGFVAAINAGINFEKTMAKVQAMAGVSAGEMGKLTDKAKEMGIKTKFSATQAGEGMYYLASAGWKTKDMLNGLEGIMNLAAASGEDLASTTNYVVGSMKALGLEAKDSARFADVLAKAAANSNTNVAQMGEAFKAGAGTAGTLKYTLEDTALAFGLMANSNIKGSQAGRLFSTGLLNMVSPTKKCGDEMKKLGISMTDADGVIIPFPKMVDNLRGAFNKLTPAQKASSESIIFGKNAIKAWQSIVNATPEDVAKLTKAIKESGGAAKTMADIQLATLDGRITLIKSSMEGLGIKLYELMNKSSAIKGFANIILDVVNKISALPDSIFGAISAFALLIAAIGPAILVLGGVITAFGLLAFGISMLLTPIGIITVAITGLITLLGIGGLAGVLLSIPSINMDGLKNAFQTFKNKAVEVYGYLKDIWKPAIKYLLTGDPTVLAKIKDEDFRNSLETLKITVDQWAKKINEFVDKVQKKIKSIDKKDVTDLSTSCINTATSVIKMVEAVYKLFVLLDKIAGFFNKINISAATDKQRKTDLDAFFGTDSELSSKSKKKGEIVTKSFADGVGSGNANVAANFANVANNENKLNKSLEAGFHGAVTGQSYSNAIGASQNNVAANFQQVGSNVSKLNKSGEARSHGANTGSSFGSGVGSQGGNVAANFSNIASNINKLNKSGEARSHGSSTGSSYAGGIGSQGGNVANSAANVASRINGPFSGLINSALSWGSSIGNSIASGLRSAAGSVANAASWVASKIASYFPSSPAKEGALRAIPKWMPTMINMMNSDLLKGADVLSKTTGVIANRLKPDLQYEIGMNASKIGSSNALSNSSNNVFNFSINGNGIDANTLFKQFADRLKSKGVVLTNG
jgi:TP901 family phage tail tape measure protein